VPALQKLGEPLMLLSTNPTAETLAQLIYDYALAQGFPVVEVRLWETPKCCAVYCGNSKDEPSPPVPLS